MTLSGKTVFITGGSRGIGLAIGLRAAREGANVTVLAKSADPSPRLPGTVYSAAGEIEAAGGQALPIVGDVRDADAVAEAVRQTVERFGGIDVCINNASALSLTTLEETEVKRYDLMQAINARGTFVATRACLPHLRQAENPHVLTLSPPINLDPYWLGAHAAYTLSKYAMTLLTLGVAAEQREHGVAANCLWPRTAIATSAVQNLLGGDEAMARSRRPEIVSDAAHVILTKPARDCTGNAFIDDDLLAEEGITDLEPYRAAEVGGDLKADFFVDPSPLRRRRLASERSPRFTA